MIAALALSLLAMPNESDVLVASSRAPIAVLIGAPRADRSFTSKLEVRAAIVERLEFDTAFRAHDVPDDLLASCKGAIGCIVRGLPADPPRLLLIVTLVDRAKGARLDVTLVDVPRAASYAATTSEGDDNVEVDIARNAVLARRPELPIKDVIELGASIRSFFEQDLRPIFEPTGEWRPFGTLEIYAPSGMEVLIDGNLVGRTQLGTTRVADVRAGPHDVMLRGARGKETSVRTEVRVAAVSPLDFRPRSSTALARDVTFWSGIGAAAVGLAITAVAANSARNRPDAICFRGSADCTQDQVFASAGASYDGGLASPHNPGGLLLAPFGLSLAATGGISSLGTLLFGGEEDLPWIQVLTGVAAGIATYGLCVALD